MPHLPRIGRSAAWAIAMALSGCGAAVVPSSVPTRPTPLVRVEGGGTHLVGEELSRDGSGNVEVALHDGRRIWVAATRVRVAPFTVGEHVAMRWDATAAIHTAEVIALSGELLRVRWDTDRSETLVSPSSVIAVTTEPLATSTPDEASGTPPENQTAALPAVPPVIVGEETVWAVGRAVRCDDGVVVLFGDGTSASIPEADIRPMSAAIGMRVTARYGGGVLNYFGRLERLDGAEALVRYEDDSEEAMPIDRLTYVFGDPAGAAPRRFCSQLRGSQVIAVLVPRYRAENVARVEACEGESMIVRRPLADAPESVPRATAIGVGVAPGDLVVLRWNDASRYVATVVSVDGPTMSIRYEDGSEENRALAEIHARFAPHDGSGRSATPARCE